MKRLLFPICWFVFMLVGFVNASCLQRTQDNHQPKPSISVETHNRQGDFYIHKIHDDKSMITCYVVFSGISCIKDEPSK